MKDERSVPLSYLPVGTSAELFTCLGFFLADALLRLGLFPALPLDL